MASKKQVKFIQIIIRLAKTQSFEIYADERVKLVTPDSRTFYCSNVDQAPDALLHAILQRLEIGFGSDDITLEVDKQTITGVG